MTFLKEDLLKLTKLARLALTEAEKEHLLADLDRIVEHISQLNEVDVENVKPLSHPGDNTLLLRDDEAHDGLGHECVKSSAGFEDGLIRVPKIID